jgi:Flp pilus assembly protein TadB
MTRLALAAAATAVFIAAYSLSPLIAVGIAAIGAALLTAAVAISLRQAELKEIEHVMEIIEACVVSEREAPEAARIAS